MFELEKPEDIGEMIYIFVGEEDNFILPFKGSESEMLQYWDVLAERGIRIKRIHYLIIQTAERNPYTPLL